MLVRCRVSRKGRQQFVDAVKVLLSSGSGGDGASIMAHEHGNEFAGPGGGNGGNGGNVLLRCTKQWSDLSHIKAMGNSLSALAGSCGYSRKAHGRRGRDLWLELPVGTEVIDADTNEVLYDLDEDGLELLLLEGGQGGKGNSAFANKWHHSPVESTRGLPGNTMLAQIELKTLADCGLIGYPNAGKSSLLSAISSSKPVIAPYAFTTLRPYVGVLHDLYGNTCRVADVPGLIEGAYENRGLGHRFLRHVERSKSLAFVVDLCDTYNPSWESGRKRPLQPWDVVALLQDELEYYLPHLSDRVIMVFANKMDLEVDAAGMPLTDKLEELQRRVNVPVFPVSAALGIRLGANHASTGLAPAVSFLCDQVFRLKTTEQKTRQQRRTSEQRQLDSVFERVNNGIFRSITDNVPAPGAPPPSLVDQQLGLLGSSGLGDEYDGYEQSMAKGKLHGYRDLTMGGRYWSLTRDNG